MAIHETKIKWHDLIEDSNDLPDEGQTASAIVLYDIFNKEIITNFAEIDCKYDRKTNSWVYYDDYFGIVQLESYKKPFLYDKPFVYDKFVVAAWSEEMLVYTPDISKLKEEPDESD